MALPLSLKRTAAEIGRSEDWFHKNWARLVRDEGFPLPIHTTRPYVWAPEHIEAWKDRRLYEALKARVLELRGKIPDLVSEQDARVEEQRRTLRKKFGVEP
jgi:predicted DNA-binding transcriptional regulator AlpA